jgi:hypothetical protein
MERDIKLMLVRIIQEQNRALLRRIAADRGVRDVDAFVARYSTPAHYQLVFEERR